MGAIALLIFVSLALRDTPVMLQEHRYGASALNGMSVCSPAFTVFHCTYPFQWRDGRGDLICLADDIAYRNG